MLRYVVNWLFPWKVLCDKVLQAIRLIDKKRPANEPSSLPSHLCPERNCLYKVIKNKESTQNYTQTSLGLCFLYLCCFHPMDDGWLLVRKLLCIYCWYRCQCCYFRWVDVVMHGPTILCPFLVVVVQTPTKSNLSKRKVEIWTFHGQHSGSSKFDLFMLWVRPTRT